VATRKTRHETPAERFQGTAAELIKFHEQRGKKAGKLGPAAAKKLVTLEESFHQAAAVMKAATPPAGPPAVDISDFFGNISAGLVRAQRNLDDQSSDYLKTVAAQPHALPAIFRIPKVSAELKFALDTTKKNGVNLIFYQDQTSAEELHQQTVQFDIVATPPPPDLVASPTLSSIVRLKSDRQAIQKTAALPAGVGDFDRIIILEMIDTLQNAAPDTATRQYVLLYADATNLGVWWLQVLKSTGTGTAATILPLGPVAAALASLQSFVAAAGDRQKAFLASLP
jgi:hypothetical protein